MYYDSRLGQVVSPVGGAPGPAQLAQQQMQASAQRLTENLRASRAAAAPQPAAIYPTSYMPRIIDTAAGRIPFYDEARREMPTQMQIEALLAYKRASESAEAAGGTMPDLPKDADVIGPTTEGDIQKAAIARAAAATEKPAAGAGVGIALALAALFLLGG